MQTMILTTQERKTLEQLRTFSPAEFEMALRALTEAMNQNPAKEA